MGVVIYLYSNLTDEDVAMFCRSLAMSITPTEQVDTPARFSATLTNLALGIYSIKCTSRLYNTYFSSIISDADIRISLLYKNSIKKLWFCVGMCMSAYLLVFTACVDYCNS